MSERSKRWPVLVDTTGTSGVVLLIEQYIAQASGQHLGAMAGEWSAGER